MLTCDYNMPVLMMELRAGLSGSSRMAKVGTLHVQPPSQQPNSSRAPRTGSWGITGTVGAK